MNPPAPATKTFRRWGGISGLGGGIRSHPSLRGGRPSYDSGERAVAIMPLKSLEGSSKPFAPANQPTSPQT